MEIAVFWQLGTESTVSAGLVPVPQATPSHTTLWTISYFCLCNGHTNLHPLQEFRVHAWWIFNPHSLASLYPRRIKILLLCRHTQQLNNLAAYSQQTPGIPISRISRTLKGPAKQSAACVTERNTSLHAHAAQRELFGMTVKAKRQDSSVHIGIHSSEYRFYKLYHIPHVIVVIIWMKHSLTKTVLISFKS